MVLFSASMSQLRKLPNKNVPRRRCNLRTKPWRLVRSNLPVRWRNCGIRLASLGQLTAGIAHEIKNPLNFVNNFSSLSIELSVELQEAIKSQEFNDEKRTEIHDLLDMLQGNLGKIAQHGKRADSIVKNMLLHSRQISGEHRSVD